MVSTHEICTYNIMMKLNPSVSTKITSSIKPLHKFLETLYVKHNTAVHRLGESKAKRKETKTDKMLWSNIANHCGYTKINQKFRKSLYNWILHHPQVV